MAGFSVVMLFVMLFIYLISGALALANYILTSLSLYTVASRRLIKNAWLCWLPIGKEWILGSIADEYDNKNGIKRAWRKILLVLSLVSSAGACIFFVSYFAMFFVMGLTTTLDRPSFPEEMVPTALSFFAIIFFAILLLSLVSAALQAITYICYFKFYESTVPQKAVKYFLISFLVPFGMPICLYKAKDQGYMNIPEFLQPPVAAPVAEQPATEEPAQEAVEQPQETEVVASEPEQAVTEPTEQPKED